MTMTVTAFVDLLAETREYLKRYVAGQMRDPSRAALEPDKGPEMSPADILVFQCAMQARNELFAIGKKHGLTENEITAALLRPFAHALRPTAAPKGCNCPRCSFAKQSG